MFQHACPRAFSWFNGANSYLLHAPTGPIFIDTGEGFPGLFEPNGWGGPPHMAYVDAILADPVGR